VLTVSQRMISAFESQQQDRLAPRVAVWLQDELGATSREAAKCTPQEVHDLCRAAGEAGMYAETDYALFALLLARWGGDWRRLLATPAVREAMGAPHANAPSKLLWLDDRLFGSAA